MTAHPVGSLLLGLRRFGRRYGARFWIGFLALCAGGFLVRGRNDFERAIDTLAGCSPGWILLIVIAQASAVAIAAWTYRLALRQTGHCLCLRRLVELHLERKVVGTIMPAGGPASVYVFVRGLGRQGISSEDALFTIGLRSLVGYASFVSLLFPVVLLTRPTGIVLVGASILVAGLIPTVGIVLLLLRHQRAARWLDRRLPGRVGAMLQRVRGHRVRPRDLATPYALALSGHLASVATLAVALIALGHSPSVITVLAGYTVGTTIVTLAPVFQGIGIVEVTMAVTLQQFGVPPSAAIGATLLYRGATVWFPLMLGVSLHIWRRAPLPSRPLAWPQPRFLETLPAGAFRRGVVTPVVVAALMVTLSGPDASLTPRGVDERGAVAGRTELVAR